jgi:hypothetical protein
MRRHALLLAVAVLAGCPNSVEPRKPSPRFFYYPTGVAFAPGSPAPEDLGFLYVTSSNWDRCYDLGQVHAVPLEDVVGSDGRRLPAVGAPVEGGGVLRLTELGQKAIDGRRAVQTLATEMALWRKPAPAGQPVVSRLFIPALGEDSPLHVLDVSGSDLTCVGPQAGKDSCYPGAPSLEVSPGGGPDRDGLLPRAPAPFGVGVNAGGDLYVTHTVPADSPRGSNDPDTIFRQYVVHTRADNPAFESGASPAFPTEAFLPTEFPSHAVAVGSKHAFITGRAVGTDAGRASLLRVVSNDATPVDRAGAFTFATRELGLENVFSARDARGVALRADEKRLFVATRSPSALLEVEVGDPTGTPTARVVRGVPLPPGADQVRVIERAEGRELVVVSLSQAGSIALYDAGLGQVVANVSVNPAEAGLTAEQIQPYGLAIQLIPEQAPTRARIFVSLFGDGRVAVVDVADLKQPEGARMIALIGQRQLRGVGREATTCVVEN